MRDSSLNLSNNLKEDGTSKKAVLLLSTIHTDTQDICLYIKLTEGIAVYQGGGYQYCGLKR
jgi:hypothetical protein